MFRLRFKQSIQSFCKWECGSNGGYGCCSRDGKGSVLRNFLVLQRSLKGEHNFG